VSLWLDLDADIEEDEDDEEEEEPSFRCEICGTRFGLTGDVYSDGRGDWQVATCPKCGTLAWAEDGFEWASPLDEEAF
jgi:transcription initiation factor IIE alpha subunit